MNIVLGILLGLLVLTILVVAHEFGHFIMARKSGVRVKEFGIGFPPRAICWVRSKPEKGKRKGKWTRIPKKDWEKEQDSLIFSLNWLPIGGFCAMDGESDDDTRPGTFGSVSFWKKTKTLFAGVTMNLLVAFLIFLIMCWVGMPIILGNQFTIKSDEIASEEPSVIADNVRAGSPAEQAGFKTDDVFISAFTLKQTDACKKATKDEACRENVVETKTFSDITAFNKDHAGQTVHYVVSRQSTEDESREELVLSPTLNPEGKEYLLGVDMRTPNITYRYTWSAPIVAAGLTVQATGETFVGIGKLIVNLVTGTARQVSSDESIRKEGQEQLKNATEGVSGIVGVVGGYFPRLISSGLPTILLFSAVISISLACMNIIPIPALDGGRWFLIFLYRLRHKRLPKDKEQSIVSKSILVLIFLIIIVTILDVIKLF